MENSLKSKPELQGRIENYWQHEADSYSARIWEELNSFKKKGWAGLIDAHRPAGERLKVLDIGTGPGFFAMLLSGMGHQVTAIDCTESMLATAQRNLKLAGFAAEFHRMDSHELSFADNTFDLILCRNLTWTLRDPRTAYREWQRVLKPGGRILIFDANWHMRLFDSEMNRLHAEDQERAKQLGIQNRHAHADMEESDNIARQLYLSRRRRPRWDAGALIEMGFGRIIIDPDITDRVWDEKDKVLYRSTPMFMVAAEKREGTWS